MVNVNAGGYIDAAQGLGQAYEQRGAAIGNAAQAVGGAVAGGIDKLKAQQAQSTVDDFLNKNGVDTKGLMDGDVQSRAKLVAEIHARSGNVEFQKAAQSIADGTHPAMQAANMTSTGSVAPPGSVGESRAQSSPDAVGGPSAAPPPTTYPGISPENYSKLLEMKQHSSENALTDSYRNRELSQRADLHGAPTYSDTHPAPMDDLTRLYKQAQIKQSEAEATKLGQPTPHNIDPLSPEGRDAQMDLKTREGALVQPKATKDVKSYAESKGVKYFDGMSFDDVDRNATKAPGSWDGRRSSRANRLNEDINMREKALAALTQFGTKDLPDETKAQIDELKAEIKGLREQHAQLTADAPVDGGQPKATDFKARFDKLPKSEQDKYLQSATPAERAAVGR